MRRKIRRGKPSRRRRPQPSYPGVATRREIIAKREQILTRLIPLLMTRNLNAVDELVAQYGALHVTYVLDKFQKQSRREFILEEATLNREYRWLYAQFGAGRPFLSRAAYNELTDSELPDAGQLMRLTSGGVRPDDILDSDRLVHLIFATDITPPAVPVRPVDFVAPVPKQYPNILKPILNLGWKLDEAAMAPHLARKSKWRKVLSELAQMATDPGLINGWPGERASWAPYHALTLLGQYPAAEYAADLLTLLAEENDWLSDRLPAVWAQLGPAAAAPLWDVLEQMAESDDRLGVVLMGLLKIAEAYPAQREQTIERFITLLSGSPATRADLNAYLIYVLDAMGAETALPAIKAALAEERVNTRIVGPDGIKLLGAAFD
jgi:hypothetical protein